MEKEIKQEVKRYMDTKEFSNYVGVSMTDMREKLLKDSEFMKCVYKFDDGRKFYIKVDDGLEVLDNMLRVQK